MFKCDYKFIQNDDTTSSEATDSVTQQVPDCNTKVKVAAINLSNQEASGDFFLCGKIYRGLAADGDTTVGNINLIGAYLKYGAKVEAE